MSESATPVLPPRGEMSVKRLLETDLCPCKSGKSFGECCRKPLKDGWTPETTLHLMFEERDTSDPESLAFYALMDSKMDGKVPAEEIVANIAKRLHSPPIARALDKLEWHAINAKGLKLTMPPEPEPPPVIQGPPARALLDAQGRPLKEDP